MKLISIIGARPQFIKAAMLCHALEAYKSIEHALVHTGQHYDDQMSRVFFEEMNIPEPEINLGINNGTHGQLTGKMLIGIENILLESKPDRVVIFGDTDSTLAGALAAAKLNIPVSHVEAGLRSFNRQMPEEINRIIADDLSDQLFAPTITAARNLEREGKSEKSIHLCGDIMFDAALKALAQTNSSTVLDRYGLQRKSYILATIHRADNTDNVERLHTWLNELNEIGKLMPVILPTHPRTKKVMQKENISKQDLPHIRFMDPVGYTDMSVLTEGAHCVATDSGGLQKEAYFHKVPCLILRNETEWIELLDTTWSSLVQCSVDALTEAYKNHSPTKSWTKDLFGNGRTAEAIAGILVR